MTARLGHLAPRLGSLPPRLGPPVKIVDPFYRSSQWLQLVERLLRERGRRCEQCGRTQDADGQSVRLIADHVKERRDGGADLDPKNVQLLCVRAGRDGTGGCHNAKTAAARAQRLRRALPSKEVAANEFR